jgi:cytochrome b subunit of formate dehydrogenase
MNQSTYDLKDILEAVKELERKVDQNRDAIRDDIFELKEEMILNRDDIEYVKQLKQITTIEDYRKRILEFDAMKKMKYQAIGFMVALQFLWGMIFWYITNKIL